MSAPGQIRGWARASCPLATFILLCILNVVPAQAVAPHSSALDLTPAEDEVWVVNPDHGTVGIIETTTHTLDGEVIVGAEPWCVDVNPVNGEAWVTSMAENKVYVIDVASRTVLTTIDVGFEPFGVAFNPAGTSALVTCTGSDELMLVDVATRTVTNTLDVYRRPRAIAWRPDGTRAFISHLLMPEFLGRLTTFFVSTTTTSEATIHQVFGATLGGYPTMLQNMTIAPAPFEDMMWIPNYLINTSTGQLTGTPLSPSNIFHAVISPYNITTSTHQSGDTYYLSQGAGTPVGGPIAVDFYASRAYVANFNSNNVTVLNKNILLPVEVTVIPVGDAPIGVVSTSASSLIYVANWLSRDVSVLSNNTLSVVATAPSTGGPEPLPAPQLNGKKLFFTSNGVMAQDDVGACASCHVLGTLDARPWDLSQFGKHLRATPDIRGIGFTGAHDWTGDKDEYQDHEFGILEFTGGVGLTAGAINPPLGAPNMGVDPDLDDLGQFMATLVPRTTTPHQLPGGGLTPDAIAGEILFNDVTVGCADCHVPPFYTDSRIAMPFIKHDVGTADPADTDAAAGFDTPTLCGVWDTAPYLHNHYAQTLTAVLTTFNPSDLHGTTSHLNGTEIAQLVEFVNSIGWPDSTGVPVAAPVDVVSPGAERLDSVFPNPFAENTSLRFSLEKRAERVRIDIYDISGRHIRTVVDGPIPRGIHTAGWDSRDESGARVPPGIYFARLLVDGKQDGEKKMTVLR